MWAVLLALDDELCKDDSHGCGLACASNPELHSLFAWRIDDEFARIVIVNCCGQNSAYIASVCDFCQPEAARLLAGLKPRPPRQVYICTKILDGLVGQLQTDDDLNDCITLNLRDSIGEDSGLGHVGEHFGHGQDLAGLLQVVHYGAVSIDAELFSGHLSVLARQEYVWCRQKDVAVLEKVLPVRLAIRVEGVAAVPEELHEVLVEVDTFSVQVQRVVWILAESVLGRNLLILFLHQILFNYIPESEPDFICGCLLS
jgi:uncharacterized protein YunC (DUF1805 family)